MPYLQSITRSFSLSELVQWLWPKLIQQELDRLKSKFNHHRVRWDEHKINPSGDTPHMIYKAVEEYGGIDCLQKVDGDVIQKLMDDLESEDLLQFVTPEFAGKAQEVYDNIGVKKLTFQNVWRVFSHMLPILFPSN